MEWARTPMSDLPADSDRAAKSANSDGCSVYACIFTRHRTAVVGSALLGPPDLVDRAGRHDPGRPDRRHSRYAPSRTTGPCGSAGGRHVAGHGSRAPLSATGPAPTLLDLRAEHGCGVWIDCARGRTARRTELRWTRTEPRGIPSGGGGGHGYTSGHGHVGLLAPGHGSGLEVIVSNPITPKWRKPVEPAPALRKRMLRFISVVTTFDSAGRLIIG